LRKTGKLLLAFRDDNYFVGCSGCYRCCDRSVCDADVSLFSCEEPSFPVASFDDRRWGMQIVGINYDARSMLLAREEPSPKRQSIGR
jgi:hypothetical protein